MKGVSIGIFLLSGAVSVLAATSFDGIIYGSVSDIYSQLSTSGPQSDNAYRVQTFGGQNIYSAVTYRTPDGRTITSNSGAYLTLDSLHIDYPTGTYTASTTYRSGSFGSFTSVSVNGDPTTRGSVVPPPAVVGGDYSNGLYLGGADSFSITLAPWENRPANTLIQFDLAGPTGGFRNTFLNSTPPDNLPFNFLAPNSTYTLDITYMNIEQTTSATAGFGLTATNRIYFNVGASSVTHLQIQTVPEPGATALSLCGLAFLWFIKFRKQH